MTSIQLETSELLITLSATIQGFISWIWQRRATWEEVAFAAFIISLLNLLANFNSKYLKKKKKTDLLFSKQPNQQLNTYTTVPANDNYKTLLKLRWESE